ncbi:MAG TPA: pyrroline-5-carboxylate reductase [Acidimicrobiia bacterium]|nr:pyrroline-5-carboxylate reductase [Acidimicrobiia bacterium]
MQPTVAVIGAGAMGEAIVRGLVRAGWSPSDITAADTDASKLEALAGDLGILTTADAAAAVAGRKVVVIVVKPDHVLEVIERITGAVDLGQVIVSVAAGIPTTTYESRLPGVPVVRAMPNTPALLGEGAAAIAAGTDATQLDLDAARAVLQAVGIVVEVPESQIDAVTAVSGSGPAYVFLLAETMQASARELGLSPEVAEQLVNRTILGAGRMLTEAGADAATLRQRVTSPNGTTAAALSAFERGGFASLVDEAVRAAAARSEELGKGT